MITRAVADSISRSRSSRVSRKGPRTLVAKSVSNPSGVISRSGLTTPAFSTTTSSRGYSPTSRSARVVTSLITDKSACTISTRAWETCCLIVRRAAFPDSGVRATPTTCAPSETSRVAVAIPIPLVAPVTTHTVCSIGHLRTIGTATQVMDDEYHCQ